MYNQKILNHLHSFLFKKEILKKRFENLRLQNNEDTRTKDFFEKSLEHEARELDLIESKVKFKSFLIVFSLSGFEG